MTQPASQPQGPEQVRQQQGLAGSMGYVPQLAPLSALQMQQIQQIQQMQQLYQNPMYAMGAGLFQMYPYAMSPVLNYQLYLEQAKQNPYLVNNFMPMPQAVSSAIPFSKLPFPRAPQVAEQAKQEPLASLEP